MHAFLRQMIRLGGWLLLTALPLHAHAAAAADGAGAPVVLITGANRGIGFEFARQYAARGWQVIATARNPAQADALQSLAAERANVRIEPLDVTDLAAIDALAARYAGQPVDVLINNAAISGSPSADQQFGKIDYARFDAFMATNVRGPLKVSEVFLPHLRAGAQKKLVVISSVGGSFSAGGRESRGTMLYRSSKAALNMLMINVATRVERYGVTVTMLNPGLVDTQGVLADMNTKMNLGLTLVPIEASVAGMIGLIDSATAETSGRFYQWSGEELGF